MKKSVAIIGGGPAALFAATFLDSNKFDVTIYEKNKALGRKFLVAGKGGFNLSHSEPILDFVERYTPSTFLKEALLEFTNEDLRTCLSGLGIPTYIGSSNRIYPEKGIKPIEVLDAIIETLKNNNVQILFDHKWIGWGSNNNLLFESRNEVKADYTIFSLGGGSWKVTGSDGSWLGLFKEKGIEVLPFLPANCAYKIEWDSAFINQYEGEPLKNISIRCRNKTQKGEAVITRFGIEGNAIYGLSPQVQEAFNNKQSAGIQIDLKPQLLEENVLKKLISGQKVTKTLKNELKMSKVQIGLLKSIVSKEDFLSPEKLATKIKNLPITLIESAQ